MSSSSCYFFTCTQISQEAGKVVWHSHVFQNFPQFVEIYIVKDFGIDNKAEANVFLELSCFFNDPTAVWSLVPLTFSNPFWTSGSSQLTYYKSLTWRILSITLWNLSVTTQMNPFHPHPAPPSPLVTTNLFLIPMWFVLFVHLFHLFYFAHMSEIHLVFVLLHLTYFT